MAKERRDAVVKLSAIQTELKKRGITTDPAQISSEDRPYTDIVDDKWLEDFASGVDSMSELQRMCKVLINELQISRKTISDAYDRLHHFSEMSSTAFWEKVARRVTSTKDVVDCSESVRVMVGNVASILTRGEKVDEPCAHENLDTGSLEKDISGSLTIRCKDCGARLPAKVGV